MTMDFSRLHTYTPPQCAPENTGYTYSLSSSYSTAALEFEKEHKIGPVYDSPRMSRRSLRLHTMGGLYGNRSLTENSQNQSVSYSSSTGSSRRSVRSRKLQALSSSQSLSGAQTGQCSVGLSCPEGNPNSDTVLLSSRLEQSTVRHSPAEHSYTGSEQNAEIKRWSKMSMLSSTPLNGSASITETNSRVENGYICQRCSVHAEREEDLTGPSSLSTASVSQSEDCVDATSSISTVYSLDKLRKHQTGFLASVSTTCVHYSRRVFTSIVSVMTLLFQNVFHVGHQAKGHERKGVFLSVSNSVRVVCSWLVARGTMLKQTAFRRTRYRANDYHSSAHSSYCGSVNVKDLETRDDQMDLTSSLCDDCKGKQYLETHTTHTYSSSSCCLLTALWGLVAYTGYGLQQVGRGLGSAGTFVVRKLLSVLWLAILSPGHALTGAFWWLGTAWYQMVTLMSLVNVFILTRCFPKLLRLIIFLLPFLLLLGLWYLGLTRVIYYLPVLNMTEWRAKISILPSVPFFSLPSLLPTPSYNSEPSSQMERSPLPVTSQPVAASVDSERMARLEQSVAALWESVHQREQQASQQHGEAVELVRALQEQINTQTDKETLGLWVSQLLEPKFDKLRGEIEREASDRAQTQEQNVARQKVHADRLAQLELLLQALTSKTEEVYRRQTDPSAPAAVDVGGSQEDRDTLLAEVQRLEAELGHIRNDLQGVMGCQGKCGQFDTLQETVSTQVREELYTLFYGSEMRHSKDVTLPENLLQWLSSQYTSSSDLHATLATLERSILGNISVQLEQSKSQSSAETVTRTVTHTAGAAGMTEEQVQIIVHNALTLYSQDRTGLVDYALESGGGSILSTRCSETYETKTALMSLFGVPLWYFSQSPRVVIQPDVYPGNCWAFKGSQGYLVIRLSLSVLPTSFCLEHIPKALSPTGNISSAPHHFRVYGLEDEYQEEGKLLGDYAYQEDGESLQTFPVVENNDRAFQIIELRVLSNWGHPEYTCIYRFRVHGDPSIK
ncbi:SUN domain-containing protein 1 isoform X1 [Electrophorus electricus]|uniref:SUN domain-containing protein n=2 Tax=Electrophorus electricus TaxID=8005 RepID=A0A4W4GMA1_ELEEL|nr:SUN domain-containing protein 1 isoform X1 [Electrophorus electricus]XP_026862384.2 SUN domain-containing protein 1 isoform X1 [Electrophorus electricus]